VIKTAHTSTVRHKNHQANKGNGVESVGKALHDDGNLSNSEK
jgi:hypothetical protein